MSNRSVFCKFFSVCSPQKQNLPRGYCAHPFPSFAESKSSRIPYVHRFVWQVLRGAFSQKNISHSCFPERRIVQRVVLLVEYLAQTHLPKDKACRDGTVRIHNINRQRVPATAQLQRSRIKGCSCRDIPLLCGTDTADCSDHYSCFSVQAFPLLLLLALVYRGQILPIR